MKFKVGDRVRVKSNSENFNKYVGEVGTVMDIYISDAHPFKVGKFSGDRMDFFKETDLVSAVKTLDTLEEGDVLINGEGDEIIVLGVCGQIVWTTNWSKKYTESDYIFRYTIKELKGKGVKVKGAEEGIDMKIEDGKLVSNGKKWSLETVQEALENHSK